MKKFTLVLALAGGLYLQANSQGVNPATLSRSGAVVEKSSNAPMSFTNPQNGVSVDNSGVQKFGGVPAAAVAFSDDFSLANDTTGLKARGYVPYYRGTGAMGTTAAWFQGNAVNWPDYNNGSSEYVSSNYNSVTGSNNIDNWLVLPAMNIVSGDVISFYSRSPANSTFPDSIRVMYSAVGDSVPEDLSWVELGRFKVNTAGAWELNNYSAPAAGTTARFAIRYCVVAGGPLGTNSDLIGIDQLDVFTPAAFDMQAISVTPLSTEYTRVPLSQAGAYTLSGNIKNNGATASTGGTALFEVVDTVTSAVVFTNTVNLPGINAGASSIVAASAAFTPSAIAHLRSRVTVTFPSDANPANDIASSSVTAITDTIYARDDDNSTGSLGIGAGPADGIVGQNFMVISNSDITSVSLFITDGFSPATAGSPVYATLHTQTPGSTPDNTPIATTTTITITPGQIVAPGQWFHLPISTGAFNVAPGLYYVGVHEVDSLLTLGTTPSLYTANSVWVTWNTIPAPPAVNGWAAANDFGFNVAYNLRLNLDFASGINDVDGNSAMISVYPSPASSELNIQLDSKLSNAKVEIFNTSGQLVKSLDNVNGFTSIDVSSLSNGLYSVKVKSNGNEYTKRFSMVK